MAFPNVTSSLAEVPERVASVYDSPLRTNAGQPWGKSRYAGDREAIAIYAWAQGKASRRAQLLSSKKSRASTSAWKVLAMQSAQVAAAAAPIFVHILRHRQSRQMSEI